MPRGLPPHSSDNNSKTVHREGGDGGWNSRRPDFSDWGFALGDDGKVCAVYDAVGRSRDESECVSVEIGWDERGEEECRVQGEWVEGLGECNDVCL